MIKNIFTGDWIENGPDGEHLWRCVQTFVVTIPPGVTLYKGFITVINDGENESSDYLYWPGERLLVTGEAENRERYRVEIKGSDMCVLSHLPDITRDAAVPYCIVLTRP